MFWSIVPTQSGRDANLVDVSALESDDAVLDAVDDADAAAAPISPSAFQQVDRAPSRGPNCGFFASGAGLPLCHALAWPRGASELG